LVGHQSDSIFPSGEPVSAGWQVELLPDYNGHAGEQHEAHEDDDEADYLGG